MLRSSTLLLACLLSLLVPLWTPPTASAQDSHADPLAEPNWPIGVRLPPEVVKQWDAKIRKRLENEKGAHLLVWTPPEAELIRAVMLIPENTDSVLIGEHEAVREVAAKHGIAIISLKHVSGNVIERMDPPKLATEHFAAILQAAADKTGHPEIVNAPFITLGKSSRGRFPFRTTWWFPDRVVCSISYHGEAPSWPMEEWSKVAVDEENPTESVLHLNIQGLSEWDGTWYRHVRPMLLNYQRHTGWLTHQVVIYGVGHGYYTDYYKHPAWGKGVPEAHTSVREVWDYIALFIDNAMELRVPEDADPTAGPVALRPVDRGTGYLIHPRAIEEMLGLKWFAFREDESGDYEVIPWPEEKTPVYDGEQGTIPFDQLLQPASDIPREERTQYMWVPNERMARAWLKLHNLYDTDGRVMPEEDEK